MFASTKMKISYSRGFPYGAPLATIRGGATKAPEIREYLKNRGFIWNPARFGWEHYLDREDFTAVLVTLRDEYDCEIVPKAGMDSNYILDLGGR
jgi:hypothetical protein